MLDLGLDVSAHEVVVLMQELRHWRKHFEASMAL